MSPYMLYGLQSSEAVLCLDNAYSELFSVVSPSDGVGRDLIHS